MAIPPTILIADRDSTGLSSRYRHLNVPYLCTFSHVTCEEELLTRLAQQGVEILIFDMEFCVTKQGLTVLSKLRQKYPHLAILPIIPAGQPSLIKEIMALDLYFFIHKPIDLIETQVALKRIFERQGGVRLKEGSRSSQEATFHGMLGSTPAIRKLFSIITKIAEDDLTTVLIRGESGTGKEMVAKAIHAESRRCNNNFVAVNCAAIPDDLLESELFGYIKGAFTGATTNKIGRIQYADNGTLFLDEIGDMKASLQAKLLRVLQEKEFEPVGALKPIPVNTRIVAATHCDLEQLVKEGKFREDLYYRLSVIPLHIPPLKERSADIPLLIDAFMEKYTNKRGREPFSFSQKAMAALVNYEWRGNVRELENLMQHMSILYSGKVVHFDDLPEKLQTVQLPDDLEETEVANEQERSTLADVSLSSLSDSITWQNGEIDFNGIIDTFETQLIVQAMRLAAGNKKEAARILKLKRTTLLEKIKKKDIEGLWEK